MDSSKEQPVALVSKASGLTPSRMSADSPRQSSGYIDMTIFEDKVKPAKSKKGRKTLGGKLKAAAGGIMGALTDVAEESWDDNEFWCTYTEPIQLSLVGTYTCKARVVKQFNSQPEPVVSDECALKRYRMTKEPWSLYVSVWTTRQYDNETNGFVGTRQVVRRMLTTDLANCWMKSSFREYLVKILGIGDPAVDPGCIDISFKQLDEGVPEFHAMRNNLFQAYDQVLALFAYYSALSAHPELQVCVCVWVCVGLRGFECLRLFSRPACRVSFPLVAAPFVESPTHSYGDCSCGDDA